MYACMHQCNRTNKIEMKTLLAIFALIRATTLVYVATLFLSNRQYDPAWAKKSQTAESWWEKRPLGIRQSTRTIPTVVAALPLQQATPVLAHPRSRGLLGNNYSSPRGTWHKEPQYVCMYACMYVCTKTDKWINAYTCTHMQVFACPLRTLLQVLQVTHANILLWNFFFFDLLFCLCCFGIQW